MALDSRNVRKKHRKYIKMTDFLKIGKLFLKKLVSFSVSTGSKTWVWYLLSYSIIHA